MSSQFSSPVVVENDNFEKKTAKVPQIPLAPRVEDSKPTLIPPVNYPRVDPSGNLHQILLFFSFIHFQL